MQLAHVERPGTWRLAQGWKESLQEIGEYHDALERLRPIVGYETTRIRIVDEKNLGPPFEGVVVGKGLDDELGDKLFAVVRTREGDAVYLRLPPL